MAYGPGPRGGSHKSEVLQTPPKERLSVQALGSWGVWVTPAPTLRWRWPSPLLPSSGAPYRGSGGPQRHVGGRYPSVCIGPPVRLSPLPSSARGSSQSEGVVCHGSACGSDEEEGIPLASPSQNTLSWVRGLQWRPNLGSFRQCLAPGQGGMGGIQHSWPSAYEITTGSQGSSVWRLYAGRWSRFCWCQSRGRDLGWGGTWLCPFLKSLLDSGGYQVAISSHHRQFLGGSRLAEWSVLTVGLQHCADPQEWAWFRRAPEIIWNFSWPILWHFDQYEIEPGLPT